MTQQIFKTPHECLKWCLDHPGQRCRDGEGREVWCDIDYESDVSIRFSTNIDSDGGKPNFEEEFNLFPSDLEHFDLTTLRPVEPEKPTLENLAALENWDWMIIKLPGGSTSHIRRRSGWVAICYSQLQTALSAGWPVEFGRIEA